MPKVVISDRIRFSRKLLPKSLVLKRYDRSVYDETKCETCDNLPYRHNDICDACPAFMGRYRFFSQSEAKNGVWSVPQGDINAVITTLQKRYPDLKIVDKRLRIPFKNPIKFTGKLYGEGDVDDEGRPRANQKMLVKRWFKHRKNGVIRAAPRSGKTVVATACYCKLGVKTVIIANQKEFLKQFYETATGHTVPTFRGNKKIKEGKKAQRRTAATNIGELQKSTGKEIIRYIDKFSQLEKATEDYDIILLTYQALMRDPKRIMKYLNGRFSLAIVDEQHRGNAHGYMTVLAQLDMYARLSVSATDKRKDGRDNFGSLIMGPVIAASSAVAMVPQIFFEPTDFTIKPMPKMWPTVYKKTCYDVKRNKLIVRKVFEDLRAGHKVILVPLDYIEHIKGITKMINKQAALNNKKRGEDWPIKLASEFHRQVNREKVIHWVDSTKWDVPNNAISKDERGPAPRVLVARASMIQEGLDWARPTCIYISLPMSGNARAGAPKFYQLVNRVCTPIKGKQQPIARIFIDDINMFKGAISGLFWQEIFPNSNWKLKKDVKYYVSKQQMAVVKALTARKKTIPKDAARIFSGSWV